MAKRPELLIASGPMSGTRFQVTPAGIRLGRSSSNDIHVPDEELSRNHCLFECAGESGIRVIDLASANGTYVNGTQLGSDPVELSVGDRIEVGSTQIVVVGEGEAAPVPRPAAAHPAATVDLGLGSAPKAAGAPHGAVGKPAAPRHAPLANFLWVVAALVVAAAIAVVLYVPRASEGSVKAVEEEQQRRPELLSLVYEKVEADATRIFRYQMTIDEAGMLRVVFDDVPGANRHVDKPKKLDAAAMKRVLEILETPGFSELDDEYAGGSASGENALKSWRIRVVRFNDVKDIVVENTVEPEAFRTVREALEAFSRNELGIWAIQYSREKLIELSADSAATGDAKWEEREVEYGNLSAALHAYKEAVFYLDTVNPKPEGYPELKEKLERTEAELSKRYSDQRFLADKAMNLADWETAQDELRILREMVPDKDDPRHAEATAKLVDVENRMKKAKKGGR